MKAKRKKNGLTQTALVLLTVCLLYPFSAASQEMDSLATKTYNLQKVVVVSNRTAHQRINNVQIGQEKISIDDLKHITSHPPQQ